MFEKIIKKEIIISERLEEYISGVIGDIDCGEIKYNGDEGIINREKYRKDTSRKAILALLLTFYRTHTIRKALNKQPEIYPEGRMDSAELESVINYTMLGILKSCLRDSNATAHYYHERATKTPYGAKYDMYVNIKKRNLYYANKLLGLIKEKEELLEAMNGDSYKPFDFKDESMITYKESFKFLNKPSKNKNS